MTSKSILSLAVLVSLCTVGVPCVQAEVVIPEDMLRQIETLTSMTFNLYSLDQAQGEAIYAKIDQWVEGQIPLNDAAQIKGKRSSRLTWVKEASQNTPILIGDEKPDTLPAAGPVRIKYVKKPQGRAFVKALRKPKRTSMDKELVAGLARQFIGQNGFVWQTNRDVMGNHLVVNWVCRTEKSPGKKSLKLFVLQRTILKRTLDGLEVLNSRQIVDLHPQSGEILGFKHLNWMPVFEANSKAVETLRGNDVLVAIQQALKPTSQPYVVTAVKAGLYQGDDTIYPVLAVRVERAPENPPEEPLRKVLIVSLLESTNQPEREEPREWPEFPRH